MEQYDTFNRVYDATRSTLLRRLIPRVRSSADVEDLTQEIYRKLYRQMTRRYPRTGELSVRHCEKGACTVLPP